MKDFLTSTKPDPNKLPGFWEPSKLSIPELDRGMKFKELDGINSTDAFILENVLSEKECSALINLMNRSPNFENVGVQGMKDKKDEKMGSVRTSIWSPELAEQIWNKIKFVMQHENQYIMTGQNVATDWWQTSIDIIYMNYYFIACAVSPLLRFMKYEKGGTHFPHYDAGFIYPDESKRTLKSMVIYLTTNKGCATRFIKDKQNNIPIWKRNHDDWNRTPKNSEIIAKSDSVQGNVLIFNHRLCHDVEKYLGDGPRIIIRGDIVYSI